MSAARRPLSRTARRIAPLALLASCGSAPEIAQTPDLPGEWTRQQRSEHCNARLAHYRALGVWKHGGVAPGVDRAGWRLLTSGERAEIFLIAACLGTGGAPGTRIVTVSRAGNGPEIATRRVVVK